MSESQRRVSELEAEVQRQAFRAESAEHERREYRAVVRLAADGENVQAIARAVLAKWTDAPAVHERLPEHERRPQHEAVLRHIDDLKPTLRRIDPGP